MRNRANDILGFRESSNKGVGASSRRRQRALVGLAVAAAAAVAFFPQRSLADTVWAGTTGDWLDPANWSIEIPLSTDNADIDNGGTAQLGAAEAAVAATFTLGSSAGQSGSLDLSDSGSLSVSGNELVGNSGAGTLTQTGGTNAVSGYLSVGDLSGSNSSYTLSGNGSIAVTGNEDSGYFGDGTFIQTGGTNTIGGYLSVADQKGSISTYTLSGSASLSDASENVGYLGIGTFTQMGGTNTVNNGAEFVGDHGTGIFNLSGGANTINAGNYLSVGAASGSVGTYNLSSSGSLAVSGEEDVGFSGSGTFNQTGGTNTAVGAVYVGEKSGSTGAYNLSGGTLGTANIYVGGNGIIAGGQGTFTQTGGSNTTTDVYLGNSAGANGTYNLGGTGSLSVSGNEQVGVSTAGNFYQTGGTNSIGAGGSLTLGFNSGSDGTYTLSGTGSLTVGGEEYVGFSGTGVFTQSAGTNTINGGNYIAIGEKSGSTGTYALTGTGELTINGNEVMGYSGTGTFNQNGGTNTVNGAEFVSDHGTGTYNLSGGADTVNGDEFVGDSGMGTFNLSGGTDTISGGNFLTIGSKSGSIGTYNLGGDGSIAASGEEDVGYSGTGTFAQTGGTNTAAGPIYVGENVGSTGAYNLSGGTSSAANIYVGGSATITGGQGTLTVSGNGNLTTPGTLKIWPTGTVVFDGGTISSGILDTSGSPAGFLGNGTTTGWIAGTLEITGSGGLTISGSGPLGSSLSLGSGQTLIVGSTLTNSGTLTLNGGAATVGGISGSGTATINSGSTLQIAPHSPTSSQSALTVNGSRMLDITDNTVVIDYGVGNPSPVSTIGGYIASGYNGGIWNGSGIVSSKVAAVNAALGNPNAYAIGYADASDPAVAADQFTPGTVVIEPAIVGDANLDGVVNFSDFQLLAASFNQPDTSWDQGNFNYGAKTNFTDFQLLAANFNESTSLDNAEFDAMNAIALSHGQTLVANGDGDGFSFVAIPEPGSLGLAAIASVGLLSRRRRRCARPFGGAQGRQQT